MLSKLFIQNYALIDSLELEFKSGFTVLTGETGAGKSLLIGALHLVLGQRADLSIIKNKEKKLVVEAEFIFDESEFKNFFFERNWEFANPCIIRREIHPNGRSRAFVNDGPALIDDLKTLSSQWIDIHSQHDQMLVFEPHFQLSILDLLGETHSELGNYKECYQVYRNTLKKIKELEAVEEGKSMDSEYQAFLLTELDEAQLIKGEFVELDEMINRLNHSQDILSALSDARNYLDTSQNSISDSISDARAALQRAERNAPQLHPLNDRLKSISIEISDVLNEIDKFSDSIDIEPKSLEQAEQRLDLYNKLVFKHKLNIPDLLIERREEIRQSLENLVNREKIVEDLKVQLESQLEELTLKSTKLSEARIKTIPGLENSMNELLANLDLPHARLEMRMIKAEDFSRSGQDLAEWYFSANKGSELQTLKKVASGGELSRVMLAVKALAGKFKRMPTILFDEIDTGVSGSTAGKIADVLFKMSKEMQVFAISHLPQLAAAGNQHLMVVKEIKGEYTQTNVHILSPKERIEEIARQMSNSELTDAAREQAKALLLNFGNSVS